MDLTGISAKWDAAVTDLQSVVKQLETVDSAGAVASALDSAADQVSAQTAALRATVVGAPTAP